MSVIKKLVGQTAVYGLSTILGRFLNFLLVPLYTRFFTQSDYGIVTELYSYTVFLMIFLTYGMETGFFRFSQEQKDAPKVYTTTLSSLFSSSLIFIALIVIFLQPITSFLGYHGKENFILWMGLIIAIDAFLTIPFAKLRHQNKATKFAVIKLINIGINIGLNVLFIIVFPRMAQTSDVAWLTTYFSEPHIASIFISNLIASIVTLLLLLPEIFRSHNAFDVTLLQRMLAYSWPLLIAGLAGSVNEVFDRISLRYFLVIPEGTDAQNYILSQLGVYGANYKLAMIITLFNQAFRFAAEPFFFSRMNKDDARELYAQVMKYFIAFSLVVFITIMLYIDVFKYFIGKDFHDGLGIVPILLLANIFLGIVFNLSIWYKITNQTKFGIYIIGVGSVITILLNILLIPHFGYIACAWATLICYVVMAVLSYMLCQKYYGIPYELRRIAQYGILAACIYSIDIFISIPEPFAAYSVKTLFFVCFVGYIAWKEGLVAKITSNSP